MKTGARPRLVRLGDSNKRMAKGCEDIRRRKVVDAWEEEIGQVSELVVDEAANRVRFLVVRSGGFLGLGATERLLPVDAISLIDDEAVYLDQTRDHIAQAPPYERHFANRMYCEAVYTHYGYEPFWVAGYADPVFARRHRSRSRANGG